MCISVIYLFLPLHGYSYWAAAVLLTAGFWLLLKSWSEPFEMAVLHLDTLGNLHWQYVDLAAGTLDHRSLIQALLIVLVWQDLEGNKHRLWVFADQLSDAHYRALARHIQLQRWRGTASAAKH